MADKFDPYREWLEIPPTEQPPDHYRLLGLERFSSDPAAIEAAVDRRVEFLQDVAAGEHGKESQKLLNEVAAARICLTSPDKKTVYDAELRSPTKVVKSPAKLAVATPLPESRPAPVKPAIPPVATAPPAAAPAVTAKPAVATIPVVGSPARVASPARAKPRSKRPTIWFATAGVGLIGVVGVALLAFSSSLPPRALPGQRSPEVATPMRQRPKTNFGTKRLPTPTKPAAAPNAVVATKPVAKSATVPKPATAPKPAPLAKPAPVTSTAASPAASASAEKRPLHLDDRAWALARKLFDQDGCVVGIARLGPTNSGPATVTDPTKPVVVGKSGVYYPHTRRWWKETWGSEPAWYDFSVPGTRASANGKPVLNEHLIRYAKEIVASKGLVFWSDCPNNFAIAYDPQTKLKNGVVQGNNADRSKLIRDVLANGPAREAFETSTRTLAQELKQFGEPCVLIPYPQMNSGWHWWAGQPKEYRQLWRESHAIFQEAGVKNVLWCWACDLSAALGKPATLADFYPGDDVVDIIGLRIITATQLFTAGADNVLDAAAKLGSKPLILTDFAPPAAADFFPELTKLLAQRTRIKGLLYYGRRDDKSDSLIDSTSPDPLKNAFRDFLDQPRMRSLSKWK